MGAELTVRQKILVAAVALSNDTETFPVEDLIVRAWTLYPESFSLRGYHAKHPDSNRVLAKLSGTDGLCGLGWLEHTDQRTYRLTRKGRTVARTLSSLVQAAGGAVVIPADDEAEASHEAAAPAVERPAAKPAPAVAAKPAPKPAPQRATATRAAREPKPVTPTVSVAPLDATEIASLHQVAKADALRKFLRGSPLTFTDACSFWGFSTSSRPAVVQQRLDASAELLKKAVESFGNGASADPRLPPLSTCYGLFNLHRLMMEKFSRELDVLRLPMAAGT